ncbi:hypothetical protein F887_01884 [Acinetobacter sp. NIPH 2100]|nr:hypothetical protein F887_01884 [Acinetobacter sp. NIPH 2100]
MIRIFICVNAVYTIVKYINIIFPNLNLVFTI